MALVTNIPLTSANVEPLSRHEMLLWVNECLQAEFAKLEQLHTGAGYCLFTEILFPGNIHVKKVKFNSRLELDWLSNWKIVQTSWKQLGIEKIIPVEKLIKGKFQDNFEFLQWFKKFFDANYDGHAYNPMEMRNFEELPKEGKLKPNSGGALKMPQRTMTTTHQKSRQPLSANTLPMGSSRRVGSDASINSGSGGSGGGGGATAGRKTAPPGGRHAAMTLPKQSARAAPHAQHFAKGTNAAATTPPSSVGATAANVHHQRHQNQPPSPDPQLIEELKQKNAEIEELRNQLTESDEVIIGLERERDFYFAKLRKIEVLCQDNENAGNLEIGSVLQILYETEEGFAPPTDDGTNGTNNEEEGTENIGDLKD